MTTWRYRVVVCGGRSYTNAERVTAALEAVLKRQPMMTLADCGDKGTGALARSWAALRGVPCRSYPADETTHGRRAEIIRNQYMLKRANPHLVIAFPGGAHTAHLVRVAKKAGYTVSEMGPDPKGETK